MLKNIQHIHFVGIGGSGMSGIAEVLINLGYKVSGSDLKQTEVTERLASLGGKIFIGHKPEQVGNAHVVVTSSALLPDNPEVVQAKKLKIPVIPRAEMLAELMRLKYAVTIAGTHGKTVTTSLVSMVLAEGGLDPTVVIGGRLKNIGSSAKMGKGEFIVAEADESDGSFLKLTPTIALLTNIDDDHLDYYKTLDNIKNTFVQFVNKVPFYGSIILCGEDENIKSIIPRITRKYYTYGRGKNYDFYAENIVYEEMHTEFDLCFSGKNLGRLKLHFPGAHNVLNSLGAAAAGIELGVGFEKIRKAFLDFTGVSRRLEVKARKKDIVFIDDYGHHPTEIRVTLETIKSIWPERRLLVIFQPHRYTRTRDLAKKFGPSFNSVSRIWLTDIYSAGEKPIPGISSSLILESFPAEKRETVTLISDREAIIKEVVKSLRPQDVLVTLGAGDVYKIGEEILNKI
ncbi:MAG: UDP-N-acetylmuramate--L-alanine ligase [Elusimicrobia bacterium]|nr:MAG: UDP-N-acetylmuramate--L-alanine ligase [Elusimicrobiota bacterium]